MPTWADCGTKTIIKQAGRRFLFHSKNACNSAEQTFILSFTQPITCFYADPLPHRHAAPAGWELSSCRPIRGRCSPFNVNPDKSKCVSERKTEETSDKIKTRAHKEEALVLTEVIFLGVCLLYISEASWNMVAYLQKSFSHFSSFSAVRVFISSNFLLVILSFDEHK